MRTELKVFAFCGAVLITIAAASSMLAQPQAMQATCAIQAYVDEIMEWDTNFPAIGLGHITTQATTLQGTANATLYTNGNVSITADNSINSQLTSSGGATLVTQYSLSYSGNGTTATGGGPVSYAPYNTFLSTGSAVTHVVGSGSVVVTLGVEAYNPSGMVAEAATYNATQTLTATWTGP